MSYTIQSTEKTKSICSDFETKALLYLMNFRDDSKEIYYFVIDFFNDLTGLDRYSNKSWDLQSKAAKRNFQTDIGKELVTLFKNYSSELNFDNYILFLGGVADSIRIDNSKNVFNLSNITPASLKKIQSAFIKECKTKTYIEDSKINDENIKAFLERVVFVIDENEKSEYIRSIVDVNPRIIPSKIELEKIFDQIRDAQSSKKNYGTIEGITIYTKDEFIYYNRHLTTNEIKMMVLNRLINNNLMQRGITPSFIPIYNKFPESERKNILEDCQLNIAKTLFDKNNSDNFWELFTNIYKVITSDESLTIDDTYKLLDFDILNKSCFLDMLSVKYFMAIIKDGIYEN